MRGVLLYQEVKEGASCFVCVEVRGESDVSTTCLCVPEYKRLVFFLMYIHVYNMEMRGCV